ncbi:MAG: hypothetical protein HKO59_04205 [Phycisphaerales bacterium]|nr:hypothetical protein [Phycisphaerae bacterium]NNF43918.1 hypothetical protein [Phycisphaerales bacterium]NNM25181.1 hypothetical protein [Phycisphaerales bacterium]
MRRIRESIEKIAGRARERAMWWAEPSGRGDDLYVVRSRSGVVADGLTQQQAMSIAGEYNLARSDAETLSRTRRRRGRRSA